MLVALVQSHIRGSATAVESEMGAVSQQAYLRLSPKQAPAFRIQGEEDDGLSRRALWNTYTRYVKLAKKLKAWDICEFVCHVYRQVQNTGSALRIDSLLIDEVQDFTQAELKLMMLLCENKNGLVLCGDTAQTISRVGFRFEDLRSLFHAQHAADISNGVPEAKRTVVPAVASLRTNFRSHDGILRAANGVVSTIMELFPESIDPMKDERGAFDGQRPYLIGDTDMDTLMRFVKASMGADHSAPIEFGANQCVIVRNAAAKAKLPAAFRDALVLTVPESKGLEFNDVLIYNFATDSDVSLGQWAAILHEDELDLSVSRLGHRSDRTLVRPSTEQAEIMALCEELKHLYVAMTRARRRVILFDEDDKRIPLFEMLGRRGLASSVTLEDLKPSSDVVSTNPWDWVSRGKELMEAEAFDEAAKCFRPDKGDTQIFEFRAMARSLQRKAQEADEEAVDDEDRAAIVDALRQQRFDAGYCFALAGDVVDARRCFESIGEGQTAELLRDAGGGTECGVCHDADSDCQLLPCGCQDFCQECVMTWLARDPTCPLCRGQVVSTRDLITGAVKSVADDEGD